MRYIKVFLLAVIFFLALVFFFQNQAPLSQQMTLTLNLFFIPPMTSIPLPFYFLVIASFFVGILLALCCLLWDRFNSSARLMKAKWQISSLQGQVKKLQKQLDQEQIEAKSKAQAEAREEANKPLPQPQDIVAPDPDKA